MPRARRKLDRIRQIHAWMVVKYPTPRPTVLRFVSERDADDCYGYVEPHKGKLRISILRTLPLMHMQWVVIHEFCHARTWGHQRVPRPEHSPEWGVSMAEIYRDFFDGEGWRESCNVTWK
jgi:hypothetical protein